MKILPVSKSPFNSVHERMIRAVVGFALSAANVTITNSIAAFSTLINALKTNLTTIDNLRAIIALPITGYYGQKNAIKKALVEMSANIMKAAYTYAITNNNLVLADAMCTSRSKMEKMKYTLLVAYVQNAINTINPIVASLTTYNVAAADITTWQTLCTSLDTSIANPKNAIANRDALNKDIQLQLRACMLMLYNQIDQLAFQFRTPHLDYYNNYKANRKLNPFTFHTQFRVHSADDLKQVVQGIQVEVLVSPSGSPTNPVGTTDAKGYCLVEGIPFGTYNVMIGGKQYGPYRFKKGQSITKHFTVPPLFATQSKITKSTVTVNS